MPRRNKLNAEEIGFLKFCLKKTERLGEREHKLKNSIQKKLEWMTRHGRVTP